MTLLTTSIYIDLHILYIAPHLYIDLSMDGRLLYITVTLPIIYEIYSVPTYRLLYEDHPEWSSYSSTIAWGIQSTESWKGRSTSNICGAFLPSVSIDNWTVMALWCARARACVWECTCVSVCVEWCHAACVRQDGFSQASWWIFQQPLQQSMQSGKGRVINTDHYY